MTTRKTTKLIHQGDFAAEVEVELLYTDDGWSPYLSLEDANRLDNVRMALRHGDLELAGSLAKIYRLTPLAA